MEFAMEHPFIPRHPRMRDLFAANEADDQDRRRRGRGPHGHGAGRGPMGMGMGMGPGFGPRPGRKRRGDVRLAALLLIAEAPLNGYQIIQEIENRSGGEWKPSPGAIYPALAQLEDEGLIREAKAAAGKSYEITEAGAKEAQAAAENPAPWEQAGGEGEPAHALMHSMRQAAQAVSAVVSSGNPELIAKATAELNELKRKMYQLLAEG